jgi:formate dehydrogenase major subunit
VPGLGVSFGRGAATTFLQDLANSDAILIMGSNMAEAHPVGFRFPMMAKQKGAVLIHVDPRFTRTSALCDQHVPIRAGSDIVFLGGLINYVLERDLWFHDYVMQYTNAATLINAEFKDVGDKGIFSGYHADKRHYEPESMRWNYEGESHNVPSTHTPMQIKSESWSEKLGFIENAQPPSDPTLQHPLCVMNILKRHYARYTPEMVSSACGCSVSAFLKVAETLCNNSGRERTSAIVYAVGWTQHTTGVQTIRAAGILQLLLGNIGRPGGGIMALRGHASIQGSTDIPTLYNLLPGYIPQPAAIRDHNTLDSYLEQEKVENGYWVNFPKFMVSLLKAWYGDASTKKNDWGFNWLPRIDEDYSQLSNAIRMSQGKVPGLFLFGQNPAAGAPDARLNRAALRKLDWLVVRDWFEIESASFWYKGPDSPDPGSIATEVFFTPAATAAEKDGCFTNTQRLLQWHDKAVDPPDDCRSDTWFVYQLGLRMKKLYAGSKLPRDQGLLNLTMDYQFDSPQRLPDGSISRIEGEPDVEKILKEINGYRISDHKQLSGFSELKRDGSTACGCWIYSGSFPDQKTNRTRSRKRDPVKYTDPEWGFAWPHNRRIMYNRASADAQGRPWSERKKFIWWDEFERKWTGLDVPDFEPEKPPDYHPDKKAKGMDAISGNSPFIMKPDGKGWLYAPAGTKDGPIPTHYEPVESPVPNLLYHQQINPVADIPSSPLNALAEPMDPDYPIVGTTFRLTEHYLSGPMSRFNSWLNELQPEMFVEISPEFAREQGILHGGWMVVSTRRGEIEARAMVTQRIRPLLVNGNTLHQIGIPFHWGYSGEIVGSIANDLTSIVLDPNVSIHEAKAFTCRVRPGRLPGRRTAPVAPQAWPTREPAPDTPSSDQPEGQARDAKILFPWKKPHPPAIQSERGFFTDTTLCIGCKACEIACKQWNQLPADGFHWTGNSYDNTVLLSDTTWRHVAFNERAGGHFKAINWLMLSDVCKHCVVAPCQESCPTGAIIYTEFGSVYVQQDICNGCGYCVSACPFGVLGRNESNGRAHKCTLCYDRQKDGLEPACAKACPTDSIIFGPVGELRGKAVARLQQLHSIGRTGAYLYGMDSTGTYSALNAFFLLTDRPSTYNLPEMPARPVNYMKAGYLFGFAASIALSATSAWFLRRKRSGLWPKR